MNRILISAAVAALLVGCARPAVTGSESYSAEPYYPPPETTVIVREVHYQEPVVYTDTVYMEADPEPLQPVYVQNEYNEYNEYNHTDVYVQKRVVVPSPAPRRQPARSPREPERRPADRRQDNKFGRDRSKPGGSDKPGPLDPRQPAKKIDVPVGNDRQQAPVPPRPTSPKRQVPVGSVQVTQVQNAAPQQAPAPAVGKTVAPASEDVQVSLAKPVRK
jgi:hypothetical protein